MLYSEIIAVCSQIHTKHINSVWAERRIVYVCCENRYVSLAGCDVMGIDGP
jgi:hypothetical protein